MVRLKCGWMGLGRVAVLGLACMAAGLVAVVAGAQGAQAHALGTAGCGVASSVRPGHTAALKLSVGGVERSYRLHVPTGYKPSTALPLLLAYHGHTSNAAAFEAVTGLSSLANLDRFVVVYPQGTVGPDGETGWNTGRAIDPKTDDLGFTEALLSHLEATLCLNPGRVYATGFSNGGGFVGQVLACDLAGKLAGVAPVSGDYYPQPGGCQPSRPVTLLEVHGTADPINPYGGSTSKGYPAVLDWLHAWAQRDACPSAPQVSHPSRGVTKYTWSGCAGGATIVHYALAGEGHIWPRGTRASDYLRASRTIASYFAL